ncbi:XkdX family protein [Enterococcus mundtii]
MFSYEQIERMYRQGFFTAAQVQVFVPLAISEKQLKKLLTEVE